MSLLNFNWKHELTKEFTYKMGKKKLNFTDSVITILFIIFIISFLVMIWYEWSLGWKMALSSVIFISIASFYRNKLYEIISNEVDMILKEIDSAKIGERKPNITPSEFYNKLMKLIKEREDNLS